MSRPPGGPGGEDEGSPPGHLRVRASAPAWFEEAIAAPLSSREVTVEGCPIHYLLWDDAPARTTPGPGPSATPDGPVGSPGKGPARRGLLFIHGGGAHAQWWRFIAPFFRHDYRVAAMDLSGMGDSGRRPQYDAAIRAREIAAVLEHAGLHGGGRRPFVVGHSFGGYMTMRFGAEHGESVGGAVIVDSPIRTPEARARHQSRPRPEPRLRVYPDFASALARFRLRPAQPCENAFIVEFIARHSLRRVEGGWTWKFDPNAMRGRRFGEPFHEHLQALRCRAALLFGDRSALVSRETAACMSELMGPDAPVVGIPEARHHVMLDQPLAFVSALRTLLDAWSRSERPPPPQAVSPRDGRGPAPAPSPRRNREGSPG